MTAQMNGNVDPTSMGGLDTFGLIRILMSRDSAAEFKKALAKTFAQMESLTASMEGDARVGDSQRTQRRGGKKNQRGARQQETAPHCRVLRRRPHAWHRDVAGEGHEGEGFGRRMARGMDDAEVKNGDIPHLAVTIARLRELPTGVRLLQLNEECPHSSRHSARIRTQHAEQRRPLLERRQRLGDMRFVGVTVDVEEEHVVPLLAMRRAATRCASC